MLGIGEIIIILVVVVIVLFGGKKVVELARGMGKFTGEFKKGKMEVEKELEKIVKEKDDALESEPNNNDKKHES